MERKLLGNFAYKNWFYWALSDFCGLNELNFARFLSYGLDMTCEMRARLLWM